MIVKALEENGAKVYIIGRRREVLDKVAKEEAVRPHMMEHSSGVARSGMSPRC